MKAVIKAYVDLNETDTFLNLYSIRTFSKVDFATAHIDVKKVLSLAHLLGINFIKLTST